MRISRWLPVTLMVVLASVWSHPTFANNLQNITSKNANFQESPANPCTAYNAAWSGLSQTDGSNQIDFFVRVSEEGFAPESDISLLTPGQQIDLNEVGPEWNIRARANISPIERVELELTGDENIFQVEYLPSYALGGSQTSINLDVGNYTLTATFYPDDGQAPISHSIPFEVIDTSSSVPSSTSLSPSVSSNPSDNVYTTESYSVGYRYDELTQGIECANAYTGPGTPTIRLNDNITLDDSIGIPRYLATKTATALSRR